MILKRGCNSIQLKHSPTGVVPKRKLPVIKTDEFGEQYVVYEEEMIPDFGSYTDYNIEDMIKAGIQPGTLNIGHSTRLSASNEFSQFESFAEKSNYFKASE